MKFTHLIEINDPFNPLLTPLTRQQLWRGLVLRAEQPQMFMPHLDECTITTHGADAMERELRYGTTVIRDSVLFAAQECVQYRVPPQEGVAGSRLMMQIEEPAPGRLYVRFSYQDDETPAAGAAGDEQNGAAQSMYDDFRRSAYLEADIDTIALIRRMADEGHFGPAV